MTEITDLSTTDSANTSISTYSTDGSIANMGTADNVFQSILGLLARSLKSSIWRLRDGTDATKLLAFNLASITTGTTRTIAVPNASGTLMLGPTSTDNAVARYDGTAGSVQNSGVLIDDSNNLQVPGLLGVGAAPATYSGLFTQASNRVLLVESTGSAASRLEFKNTGMTNRGDTQIISTNNDLAVNLGGAEMGRFLQSTGGLVVGASATAIPSTSVFGAYLGAPDVSGSRSSTSISTARTHMSFINPNGTVGSISTASAATTYATSSDQRLKEHFEDFDAGEIIDAIKIYEYHWKVDGSTGYGPKAQELYEVFPLAVVPGNDLEPGDEGFVPWSWGESKLVPLLLREIQSLRTRMAALESDAQ